MTDNKEFFERLQKDIISEINNSNRVLLLKLETVRKELKQLNNKNKSNDDN